MIITRTPFRISFAGGGTDLAAFYTREPGVVVSTAIRKYMYITVNRRFDDTLRVSYSRTEIVPSAAEVRHPIVRAALQAAGIRSGVEIVSIADIPSGTGLGSSSSFTVGLLNALYAYQGVLKPAGELAEEACRIEIDVLKEPIGKQDQYIAAFGGLCHMRFNTDGSVFVNPVVSDRAAREELERHILLMYTGESRRAAGILAEQRRNTARDETFRELCRLRDLAETTRQCLSNGSDPRRLGEVLDEGWQIKKKLAGGVTTAGIDGAYEAAMRAGAWGGKVSGAGGGGFLTLVVPPERRAAVRRALADLREMDFAFEAEGSKIIYVV